MTTEQYSSVSFRAQQVVFASLEASQSPRVKVVAKITVTILECGNIMLKCMDIMDLEWRHDSSTLSLAITE